MQEKEDLKYPEIQFHIIILTTNVASIVNKIPFPWPLACRLHTYSLRLNSRAARQATATKKINMKPAFIYFYGWMERCDIDVEKYLFFFL